MREFIWKILNFYSLNHTSSVKLCNLSQHYRHAIFRFFKFNLNFEIGNVKHFEKHIHSSLEIVNVIF